MPLVWRRDGTAALTAIVAVARPPRGSSIAVIALIVGGEHDLDRAGSSHLIVSGHKVDAHELIRAAIHIWCVNVIVFALWFWQLDGGGPAARADQLPDEPRDFLFPQTESPQFAPPGLAAASSSTTCTSRSRTRSRSARPTRCR